MKTSEFLRLTGEVASKVRRLEEIKNAAEARGGDLSRRERAEIATMNRELSDMQAKLPRVDGRMTQHDQLGHSGDYDGIPVLRGEDRMVDYLREHRPHVFRSADGGMWDELLDPSRFSLGRFIRGFATGQWEGADIEHRAQLEGTSSAGGAWLPSPMSGTLIDRLRNVAQTQKAGAVTVPMDNHLLLMGRLTSGPTPALAWHAEGSAITPSDRTVDKIQFAAQTLPNLTLISMELLNDMSDQAAQMIEQEIVKSLALEIDRVCLRGAGNGTEPCGIRNTSGVTITSLGANGALPLWDNVVDGVSVLRTANVEPNAILWAARTQQTFDKFKTAVGEYLAPPPGIAGVQRLVTNQIPTNLTQGTNNATSEIYCGAWENLMLGVREQIGFNILGATGPTLGSSVRVLQERYIDQGLAGLICFFRGDVQLAHPAAFNVLTGVTTS